MNALIFVLGVAVVWLAIGVAAGVVMARRGHDFRTWFGLGAISGPLVIRLIADADAPEPAGARDVATGFPGDGPVDVLVAIDGSPESYRALREVTELLGDRIGRISVAAVLDIEADSDLSPDHDRERARADLAAATEYLASVDLDPTVTILTGAPAPALERHAVDGGFSLVAVGPRGRGLATQVLGSVAAHLVRASPLPVLVASTQP
jgi:nucleotide-binding universal stress UspA family protein